MMTAPARDQPFASAEWIPDFQYRHFPQASNPQEIAARKQAFDHITRNAQTVVLSSAHAERDCLELFPAARGKTFVLHFRVSVDESQWQCNPAAVVGKYHLPERYLLCSNLLAPTKNHLAIVDALQLLKQRGKAMSVVFTGDINDFRNPGYYNQFLARVHERGVADCVLHLGLIPKADQFQIMRACVAVVQPSLFEGWHTGVEEAQLAGKFLVLSNIPVHVEQDPPARLYFDPSSPESLADAMHCALEQGPSFNPDVEAHARQRYHAAQQVYARDFLQLSRRRHDS
jgi:glycosyltransferase involved in cell wall biosynthesis